MNGKDQVFKGENTMNEQIFLTKMQEEVLDTESVINMDTQLGDIEEWDSLSVVSFIAMAKAVCGKMVERQSIVNAKTVSDLFKLVK